MAVPCPVCEKLDSILLVERRDVSVYQNRKYLGPDQARKAPVGNLEFRECKNCQFVWNAAFDETVIVYDQNYENCQSHSPAFRSHLDQRIARIISAFPGDQLLTIVEIGCGQATFLEELVERFGKDRIANAVGFDPAWHGEDGTGPSGTRIYGQYFNDQALVKVGAVPDILVSRHTIEHIPDPAQFLRSIRTALPDKCETRLFLETPTSDWIVENKVTHDFFYEHCTLLNHRSMAEALHRTGFAPDLIEAVFGGQYLWTEAHAVDAAPLDISSEDKNYRNQWQAYIAKSRDSGRKIAIWGAGAKGCTFASLIDPDSKLIHCLIDINEKKQGGFLPVTAHPVLSPEQALGEGITEILVMNPLYIDEIGKLLKQFEAHPNIVPIV